MLDPLPPADAAAAFGLLPSQLSTASLDSPEDEEWDDSDDTDDTSGSRSLFDDDDEWGSGCSVNPASGLPMIDDTFIDVGGNTFGTDDD